MNGARCILVKPTELRERCRTLANGKGRMQMAYAWRRSDGAAQVRYLLARGSGEPFELWCCAPASGRLPSIADLVPLLGWYEREIQDLFAIVFDGHPEPHPLVLHEGSRAARPPLEPDYPRNLSLTFERRPWREPQVVAEGVQRLPFGPIRADVTESAQFIFFYLGEGILHYYPRLFFKHRGLEKRFEGLRFDLGSVLSERVSGVGSVAHALAYCQALENATGCRIPERAHWLRCLLAELERLYNHLHYLNHLAAATTLKVADAQGRLLEERAKRINARLTGSRFLRGILCPGGLRRDLSGMDTLAAELDGLCRDADDYMQRLRTTPSYLDRLIGTGVLSRRVAFDQGATGPVERASGLDRDLRRDHPYAAYQSNRIDVALATAGDAQARAEVRMDELRASFDFARRLLHSLPGGPVRAPLRVEGEVQGLGWAETPRGALYYAVHMDKGGRLQRVKIKSPSFSNWRVFPFTVHGTDMMDYAINEASFGLTIAGCDR